MSRWTLPLVFLALLMVPLGCAPQRRMVKVQEEVEVVTTPTPPPRSFPVPSAKPAPQPAAMVQQAAPAPLKKLKKAPCEPVPDCVAVAPKQPAALSTISSIGKQSPLIVIDPGHGGKDLGTHSKKTPKYQEKSLNLTTAMMVHQYLQKWGYQTIMTRKDDVFLSLEDRWSMANRLRSKLFVSVHYNSAPSVSAEGIEVFYYKSDEDQDRTKQSKKLAQSILNRVIKNTDAKSRGVKHGDLAVIRETNMPAVLIEGGFLTNADERAKLKDKEYVKKIALGIAKGIDDYVKKSRLLANN